MAKNTKTNEHHFEEIGFSTPQHLVLLAPLAPAAPASVSQSR